MHNLFAAILAKGIGRQLKQGLYREYLSHKDNLAAVHGKIDMPGTIRNQLARKRVLTCEYDDLSENNLPFLQKCFYMHKLEVVRLTSGLFFHQGLCITFLFPLLAVPLTSSW